MCLTSGIKTQNIDIISSELIFLRLANIQPSNHVKIKIRGAFNIKLSPFIFIFLQPFKNLNKNLYENIVLRNTLSTVSNLLKLVYWLNNDIENKKQCTTFGIRLK